jgi:hypothetical protein
MAWIGAEGILKFTAALFKGQSGIGAKLQGLIKKKSFSIIL